MQPEFLYLRQLNKISDKRGVTYISSINTVWRMWCLFIKQHVIMNLLQEVLFI